ncbi:MAG TPA: hypothetical protein VJT73_09710 [Polyangiaceae bacterium]|nr:hypothetical protein [Polyangiaceae bacterium]
MKTRLSILLFAPLGVSIAACSLINAYSDEIVEPRAVGSGGGGAGGGGAAGTGGEGGSEQEAGAEEAMAGSGGSAVEIDAAVVDTATIEAGPSLAGGVIVVGADTVPDGGASESVLAVLDPLTGLQLGKREAMAVGGLAYDGFRENLWYVFENNATNPTLPAKVHVRNLNVNGTWSERSVTPGLPPISHDSIAVLRGRLAYVSTSVDDAGQPATGIAVLNTEGAENGTPVKLVVSGGSVLPITFKGIVGLLGQPGAGTSVGGNVDIAYAGPPCPSANAGQSCSALLARVTITPTGATVAQAAGGDEVGTFPGFTVAAGSFAAAFDRTTQSDLIALPPPDALPDSQGSLRSFDPLGPMHAARTAPRPFKIGGPYIRGLAIAECERVALAIEFITKPELVAVPLDPAGTQASTRLLNFGGKVIFEPFTKTIIAPFRGSDISIFEFRAFSLGGETKWNAPIAAPTITARSATSALKWTPPPDLVPVVVGVKAPMTPVCN